MGIPSYFSYIVHNHIRILKNLKKVKISVNNLYIDSNSLIYDSIYEILDQYKDQKTFETLLISNVSRVSSFKFCETAVTPSELFIE